MNPIFIRKELEKKKKEGAYNMNKLSIIGNLVKDPELRTTTSGVNVCTFTVAVNRKKTQNNQDPGVDYFRVTAWRALGDNCAKFLEKGKKVAVVGSVSLHTYESNGKQGASLEVLADDVEFLSPRVTDAVAATSPVDAQSGMTQVEVDDILPF